MRSFSYLGLRNMAIEVLELIAPGIGVYYVSEKGGVLIG
jgi:hypothetical protein